MSHGDSLRSQKKSTNAAGALSGLPELDAAYRATLYRAECADAPGGFLQIRIGAVHPPVDAWLDRVGVDCWSYLSAENPASRRLPADENAHRSAALRRALEQSGKPFLPGQAIALDGSWPPEASFLVGGLDELATSTLAGQCGQYAFVHARRGEPARLIWLARRPAADDTMP
jgi:hypothetical protein